MKVRLLRWAADVKHRNVRSVQEMTAVMTVDIIKYPGQDGQHLGRTWPTRDIR